MLHNLLDMPRLKWLDGDIIRPYVFVREENRIKQPGQLFDLDWFPYQPIYKNPLLVDEVSFANQVLCLEEKAFEKSNMAMPRWVFYDCAIMPGFVAGFAMKTKHLTPALRQLLQPRPEDEWSPISLFIIIPTMGEGEWVAHNLSSANALIPKEERFYGLGFLTKAFGLWYANVKVCCGMTQWRSPATRLHSHYGDFEVLTAYTPVHSYAQTLTYRLKSDPDEWKRFFTREASVGFSEAYESAGFQVDPSSEESLKQFQGRIERKEGPFFLNSQEIRTQPLDQALTVYRPVQT